MRFFLPSGCPPSPLRRVCVRLDACTVRATCACTSLYDFRHAEKYVYACTETREENAVRPSGVFLSAAHMETVSGGPM